MRKPQRDREFEHGMVVAALGCKSRTERENERMERSRELRHSLLDAEFERLQVASAMREAARGHA